MSVKEQVIEILKNVNAAKDFTSSNELVEGGYMDSFELMVLIGLLSDTFGIEIGFDEIIPENFNSVDAIAAMVERLK